MTSYHLHHGDCLERLKELTDNSVDAVVTDPPYGLSFMGKRWDYDVPATEVWAECLRVLKPGGHLLAFAGTRTQHRMAVRIEDAGFEIRDMIAWVYGSGFPKSMDVSKAIDKARDDSADIEPVRQWLDAQREKSGMTRKAVNEALGLAGNGGGLMSSWTTNRTTRAVPQWAQWLRLKELLSLPDEMDAEVWRLNGRKGQPGEAWADREFYDEPTGGLHGGSGNTVGAFTGKQAKPGGVLDAARQWQGWGTTLKPALEPITVARKPLGSTVAACVLAHGTGGINVDGCRVEGGRWPANLIHDGDAAADLLADAARFFYCAKASKTDRGAENAHPTVKPTDLMRYLCRLVTPPGGVVLDPFMGSGSTGKAARLEGFQFIGIEREAEYLAIAKARIQAVELQATNDNQPDLFAVAA